MFLNISKNILFETCWFEFSIVKAFCTFLFICLFLYSVFLEGGGQGEISNIHIYTLYIKVVSCMLYQDISGSSKQGKGLSEGGMVMDGKRSCSTDAGSVPGEKLTQLKTNVEASNDALGNCKFANLEMLRFLLLTKKSQNFNILH